MMVLLQETINTYCLTLQIRAIEADVSCKEFLSPVFDLILKLPEIIRTRRRVRHIKQTADVYSSGAPTHVFLSLSLF